MLFASLFGALIAFSQVPTPSNTVTEQTPTFDLHGFSIHEGAHDTNTDETPMYVPETDKLRAMVLIRFTPKFSGTCEVYDLDKSDPAKRIGPLPIFMDPDPSNTFPVAQGAQMKVIAGLPDADDIAQTGLKLDPRHVTIGVACVVDGADADIRYSELYHVDAAAYTEPTST